MKVAFAGLNISGGKTKYNDPVVSALTDKFLPAKVSPYYVDFLPGDFESAEAIAVLNSVLLDVLILDMERLEGRMERASDSTELDLLKRCLQDLEKEIPLCDQGIDDKERAMLRALGAVSLKPTVLFDSPDISLDRLCEEVFRKSGKMFFYTAGKQEVHAWLVDQGAEALTCAARIHSDLARGFIKAEIISVDSLMGTHSFQSARSEGLTSLVDRDYIIPPNTVLEIRFNV